jgi:hypothetical protein
MGRLLFERRRKNAFWLGLVLAVPCGAIGTALLFDRDAAPVGVALLAVALGSLVSGAVFQRRRFRCYELGLTRRRIRDEVALRFDEITEFTYSATPTFYKGAYVGTRVSLTFRAPRAAIRYSARVQNLDADLDDLRDQLAERIADRMIADLRAGRIVHWMSDVVFLPQGLQFRRAKLLGLASGPVEILPYARIGNVKIDSQTFFLYSAAEVKPLISKPVSTANFYPGYAVVVALLGSAGNDADE